MKIEEAKKKLMGLKVIDFYFDFDDDKAYLILENDIKIRTKKIDGLNY